MSIKYLKSILSPRKYAGAPWFENLRAQADYICIEDSTGFRLWGNDTQQTLKFPIELDREIIGWVSGDADASVIAPFLSALVQSEKEKKILGSEVLQLYREIKLLHAFSEKIVDPDNPEAIALLALQEAGKLMPFNGGVVLLTGAYCPSEFCVLAAVGQPFTAPEFRWNDNEIIRYSISQLQPDIVLNIPGEAPFRSMIYAPMWANQKLTGTILLVNEQSVNYTAEHLQWLSILAGLTASALENSYLQRSNLAGKLALEKESLEKESLAQLEQLRTQFFTNITHEFRTPLTIIIGMAELLENNSLTQNNALIKTNHDQLSLIRRNGQQLLQLINQLMDLSKIEPGHLKTNPALGDLVSFLKYVVSNHQTYAESRSIDLEFYSAETSLEADFDQEHLQTIIANLLSNALKFTLPGGSIKVRMDMADNQIRIRVQDSGIGISADDLPYIFDRFYQGKSGGIKSTGGTGIGLALSKQLAGIMGGDITVVTALNEGTVFTVWLPLTQLAPKKEFVPDKASIVQPVLPVDNHLQENQIGLATLLLIEDNPDMIAFLKICLRGIYQIEVATDGAQGIQKALDIIPDLIISDVMMPEKDGYEVCDFLKNDFRTSHIPIILLTAKSDRDSKIEGLRKGADAWLNKPFDREELLVRLERLIELRKKIKDRFTGWQDPEVKDNKTGSGEYALEEQFMQKIRNILQQKISDEAFGLESLCAELAMSRSQLFRKMKALVDESPSGYILSYRLYQAAKLLKNSALSISEVAFSVGFRDHAHFTNAFREKFGMTPKKYRNV